MKTTKEYLLEVAKTTTAFYELSDEEHKLLKKCLLDIYQDVATICDKYNLCIMLGGGSALGAVRHQGFIPWDDDLDAIMPRADYNKFIEIFEQELGERYGLSGPCSGYSSGTLFIKIEKKNTLMTEIDSFGEDIRGIKIDIFPIENTPNNKLIRIMKGYIADIFILAVASMRFYQNKKPLFKAVYMRTYKTKCYYYIRRFIGWIFSVFSKKYLYDKYDKFVSCNKGAKYRTIPTGRKYYHGEMHHESVFFPPVEALFEGIKVFIPHNTDAYLKRLYGDYMKIPSVEKRERHFYTEFSLDGAK